MVIVQMKIYTHANTHTHTHTHTEAARGHVLSITVNRSDNYAIFMSCTPESMLCSLTCICQPPNNKFQSDRQHTETTTHTHTHTDRHHCMPQGTRSTGLQSNYHTLSYDSYYTVMTLPLSPAPATLRPSLKFFA